MPDDFQAQPSPQHRAARLEFEDELEYVLRRPRGGIPAWGWLLIVLGLGLPLVCGCLMVAAVGFFWLKADAPAPPAPALAPVLEGEIGNDPDLPTNYKVDGLEKIAPPTPVPAPDADLPHRKPHPGGNPAGSGFHDEET